jgi:hypothetical protein
MNTENFTQMNHHSNKQIVKDFEDLFDQELQKIKEKQSNELGSFESIEEFCLKKSEPIANDLK